MPKLIDYHKRWCKTGKIPFYGLCQTMTYVNLYSKRPIYLLEDFRPNESDYTKLAKERKPTAYWGYGEKLKYTTPRSKISRGYTPLRQTIVLLICAMNNEL